MALTYTFTNKTTSVAFPWPSAVTGVERIALSAQGELQRVLSAYFARPISIAVVYCHTYWHPTPSSPKQPLPLPPTPTAITTASPETPIIQTRQVHLVCSGKIVCTATSTVHITSPTAAHLFLVENYAIGQMFRRMEKLPAFELLSVGLGVYGFDNEDSGSQSSGSELWRKYRLTVPDFDCEIVEEFPEREMFVRGAMWLDDVATSGDERRQEYQEPVFQKPTRSHAGVRAL